MQPVIIIDSNALCHKAKHTLGELNSETMRVGVIFGFFIQLHKLCKKYKTNQLCFAWDSKKSLREKVFPAYKEGRRTSAKEKSPEEIEEDRLAYAQFDLLYEKFLPAIGFHNNYKYQGYEGDDIIASLVYHNASVEFLIASGDEDMYQCLYDTVSIIKKNGLYTIKKFEKEYGIGPEYWAEVKAIAGCTTDEVPGIKGVGEIIAIQYLKKELSPGSKRYLSITCPEGKQIIARNRPLVTLPYPGCPETFYVEDEHLSLRGFMDMCNELEFSYFLKKENLQEWKQLLNLH
jgi:DNA polymerase-1